MFVEWHFDYSPLAPDCRRHLSPRELSLNPVQKTQYHSPVWWLNIPDGYTWPRRCRVMNSMGPIRFLKKTLRFKLLDKMPIRVEFLDILLWDLICKLLLHHWHRINHSGKNFYRKDTCFSFSSRLLRIPWVEPIIRYLKNFRTLNLMAANSNTKIVTILIMNLLLDGGTSYNLHSNPMR